MATKYGPDGTPIKEGPPKVTVIGAGKVGSTLAYTLVVERIAGEVVLVDIQHQKARGEAMDIQHAAPFMAPTHVYAGEYKDVVDSDIIVITAGAAQRPGETRLELDERNVNIFRDMIPQLVAKAPNAIYIIVANPVDALTYATLKISGLPNQQVIGSGTVLDTGRFRQELGDYCEVDPRSVHGYIIGEHGDSEVAVWSRVQVGGLSFAEFCKTRSKACSETTFDALAERVRNAAYEIIKLKEATQYAIALGASRLIESILRNTHTVHTVSVLLEGQYGIENVCLSLPTIVGRRGAQQVLEIPLNEKELTGLKKSAETMRAVLDSVKLTQGPVSSVTTNPQSKEELHPGGTGD